VRARDALEARRPRRLIRGRRET